MPNNQIAGHFVLASNPNTLSVPAAVAGFGAIFLNVTLANTSSIEYFSGSASLGKFFVPSSPNPGQPEFFGTLFSSPVVTDVVLTLGNATLFFVNHGTPASGSADVSNGGAAGVNQVATDDFVYSEPQPLAAVGLFYSAVGTDAGIPAVVTILNSKGTVAGQFMPFGANFTGGVHAAVGDFTGDNIPDLVLSSAQGGVTLVVGYDGQSVLANPSNPTPLFDFNPFGNTFAGGAFVAVGRLDGATTAEIIVSADSAGGPQVNVYSAAQIASRSFATPAASFFAYAPTFTGGVRVASSDINGDGLGDIVTGAGPGGGPQVNIYFGARTPVFLQNFGPAVPTPNISFFAFGPSLSAFTGGLFVAAIDVDNDGKSDLAIGAGAGGGPEVAFFTGAQLTQASPNFIPLTAVFGIQPPSFTGGVRIGFTRAVLPSGKAGIVLLTGAGPGGGPQVDSFDIQAIFGNPANPPGPFSAFNVPPGNFTNGLFVSNR
jgi:hypothetical protein